nr:immunoglobulin light chain junction region [Macaca mulatta]MOV72987.1 immunoglobulin light chain junction region [Macaca mulatta]MOV73406.1 immunoglobulin light chain junction region [Macaca mulatta]MOV73490.1 immunoglobulin light chain junction region [Macaca mulatta]MOV73599.1 immunoglobulin light chain junction region [Macaca mulatta]
DYYCYSSDISGNHRVF